MGDENMDIMTKIVPLRGGNPTNVVFGASAPARIVGAEAEPFDLTGVGSGGTLIANPGGAGNETATIEAAAGFLAGKTGCSENMTAEVDTKLKIAVDGGDPVVATMDWDGCNSGTLIAAQLQIAIRAATGGEETVAWSTDHYVITSARLGKTSSIEILSADELDCKDELGFGTGAVATQGTGDVDDLGAVTAAEILAVIATDMAPIVGSAVGGRIALSANGVGNASSLVMGAGTLNEALGFTGSDEAYGAVGMGYEVAGLATVDYVVGLTLRGTTSPAGKGLSWKDPTLAGFAIYCENAACVDEVGVVVLLGD